MEVCRRRQEEEEAAMCGTRRDSVSQLVLLSDANRSESHSF